MLTHAPERPETAANALIGRGFLLVYDGDCGFCRWTLDVVRRALPAVPPAVDGRRADLLPLGLDLDDIGHSSWLVELDGEMAVHHGGVEGFAQLLRRQPSWAWRLAGNLLLIPGVKQLGHRAYDWIARNRHRLPHGTTSCSIA